MQCLMLSRCLPVEDAATAHSVFGAGELCDPNADKHVRLWPSAVREHGNGAGKGEQGPCEQACILPMGCAAFPSLGSAPNHASAEFEGLGLP